MSATSARQNRPETSEIPSNLMKDVSVYHCVRLQQAVVSAAAVYLKYASAIEIICIRQILALPNRKKASSSILTTSPIMTSIRDSEGAIVSGHDIVRKSQPLSQRQLLRSHSSTPSAEAAMAQSLHRD